VSENTGKEAHWIISKTPLEKQQLQLKINEWNMNKKIFVTA